MNSGKMVIADALAAHNTVERTIEFNVFGVDRCLRLNLRRKILESMLSVRSLVEKHSGRCGETTILHSKKIFRPYCQLQIPSQNTRRKVFFSNNVPKILSKKIMAVVHCQFFK